MKLSVAYNDSTQTTSPTEFAVDGNSLITIGREPGQSIVFATTGVSRYHARILPDPASSLYLQIEDVGSTNGTFVNGNKISGPTRLEPGSRVRLGQSGPEFTIDTDPRPPMGTTADLVGTSVDTIPIATPPPGPKQSAPAALTPIQRPTIQTKPAAKSSPALAIVAGLFAVVAIGAVGIWGYGQMKNKPTPPSTTNGSDLPKPNGTTGGEVATGGTAQQIYKANSDAVVRIEVTSELVEANKQVPVYILNRFGRQVFKQLSDGSIVPHLTLEAAHNTPITASVQGTGFIFRPTGFALTCRHVVNPWKTGATIPAASRAYVEKADGSTVIADVDALKFKSSDVSDQFSVDGSIKKITASVGDKTYGVDAGSVAYSTEDIAQFRINAPDNLPTVQLDESGEETGVGTDIVVLGFSVNVNRSRNLQYSKSGTSDTMVKDDTKVSLGDGKIGNVGEAPKMKSNGASASELGDMYQLTVNTLGPGASGGPVFDLKTGKVIAVFAMSKGVENSSVTFAVPIRYGLKLFSK